MSESVGSVVESLLDEHGSVAQEEVVEMVGVSKATVSRHLKRLEEDGVIVRLPFRGRNLIWRAGETPAVMSA